MALMWPASVGEAAVGWFIRRRSGDTGNDCQSALTLTQVKCFSLLTCSPAQTKRGRLRSSPVSVS